MEDQIMTTQKQVRAAFWSMLREVNPDLYSQRRPGSQNNQATDIRCTFVDYVDQLARNGEISESLANRVTL
jgi:hypothetical protein